MFRSPDARRHRSARFLIAAVVAVSITGCGVGDSDEGADAGSLRSMLGQIADTPENRSFVVWVDIATARELAGEPVPDAGSDAESDLELFVGGRDRVVQPRPPAFMGSRFADVEDWRTEVGFAVTDVDQSIDAGVPPEMSAVVRGRIDGNDVEAAISSDPTWKDDRETAEHDGVSYSRWLDDGETDLERASPARPLGNSLRLQAADGQVRWARTDEAMEATIDAGAGDTDTLADVTGFEAIAASFEGQDVYQASLSADPGPFSIGRAPRLSPEQRERLATDALEPWTTVGVGDAVDGDRSLGVLVLTHDDDEKAETNVERLRSLLDSGRSTNGEPYADVYEVRSAERDGSTVVVVVEQEQPHRLMSEVIEQRGLVLHE
jgi:hypothetical protein